MNNKTTCDDCRYQYICPERRGIVLHLYEKETNSHT